MLTAILIMALGAVVLGAALGYASIKFKVEGNPLVEKIEAILPQTQCGQCGFPAANRMPKPSRKARSTSICARPAARKACASWPICSGAKSSRSTPKRSRSRWRSSTNRPASAARCASRPARSMPSSAPPSRCTPSSSLVHRLRTVRQALPGRVHHMEADRREHRQLEVEVSGHRNQASNAPPDPAPRPECWQQLFKFKGGVKPDTNKTPSVQAPIGRRRCPKRCRAAAPEHRRGAESAGAGRRHGAQGATDRRCRQAGCRQRCMRRPPAPSSPSRSMSRASVRPADALRGHRTGRA
jgi:hypothetical protein